jgi:hypothetical protein
MLEMTGRSPKNGTQMISWRQGAELRGHKVELPELTSRRIEGTNEYTWEEHDRRTYRLPVEPDAIFSLRFAGDPVSHFCYEADRGTMAGRLLKKFRAHHHFIKRQQKHKEAFNVHPIRAALIETTDEPRARKRMELVQHAAVIGEGKRTALFWFAISPLFSSLATGEDRTPLYLLRPEVIIDPIWTLPDLTMHSLGDPENSRSPGSH